MKKFMHYALILTIGFGMVACSQSNLEEPITDPDPANPQDGEQLVVNASSTNIDIGTEVNFTITADGKDVDAELYIANEKISSMKYTFEKAGEYEVIAKKEGYKDSEQVIVQAFRTIVYVAGEEQKSPTTKFIARYWEGDKYNVTDLSSSLYPGRANSIFISDKGDGKFSTTRTYGIFNKFRSGARL